MTKKKKIDKIDEGFLDTLFGDYGAAGMRSMFKKGMTREAQLAQDLFIKDFVADALSSLSAGVQGGFVDPNIRGGGAPADTDSMAVKTAKSRTGTQPAGTPGAAPAAGAAATTPGKPAATPAAKAAPTTPGAAPVGKTPTATPTAKGYSFKTTQPGQPAQPQQNVKVPPQNVKFNVPGKTGAVKESTYRQLNALFESIFEATGGQSIATYLTSWFNKYMGGVNWQQHKDQIQSIIQNVEDTYKRDKGAKALRQLAQAAFAIVKVSGVEPEGAKDIKKPEAGAGDQASAGGQAAGSAPAAGGQAAGSAPAAAAAGLTMKDIRSALPNMKLRDLEALKQTIDAVIAAKAKQPAAAKDQGQQTQYMGKVAPNAGPATKPAAANPLSAPTVNTGNVTAKGTAPKGDITKGGIGMTRESRRPRR